MEFIFILAIIIGEIIEIVCGFFAHIFANICLAIFYIFMFICSGIVTFGDMIIDTISAIPSACKVLFSKDPTNIRRL